MEPYVIVEPKKPVAPIIISIPHCGTEFPDEIINDYLPEQVGYLDDTDWSLQDLYDFATDLGITIIYARYSRWVIDLNRDPESAPLYNDGRIITGLTTTTDFIGEPIYKEGREPNEKEVQRRLEQYYWPYYRKIEELLKERKEKFGKVLLWDAHSIRSHVPTIRESEFPEMILGDNDEKSAGKKYIDIALDCLSSTYQVNHNDPFKGGHITRYFGDPDNNVHALQLERNKILYMDDEEREFNTERADKMRGIEKLMFTKLIQALC